MNKALDSGVKICTSYRNSKNYGTNWLSAGSSLGFMRECKFIHKSKQVLKLSTHVSGTGFYVSNDVLKFKEGWKYVTLTEDLEFSTSSTLKGEKIGFCEDAVFYDEQPIKFKQTWNQRTRWSKGSLMSFSLFHFSLFSSFVKTLNFTYYDYYFSRLFPVGFFHGLSFLTSGILQIISFCLNLIDPSLSIINYILYLPFVSAIIITYLGVFIDGLLITLLEWKKIKASAWKKIKYLFTYPIFMFIFNIPVIFYAIFKKVKWDPIEHTEDISQVDLEKIK